MIPIATKDGLMGMPANALLTSMVMIVFPEQQAHERSVSAG